MHLRDMASLKQRHPDIAAEFCKGNFTVTKSKKKCSAISIDHAHEQLNAQIKGDGGAVGITENDAALARWVIAGPEMFRILNEFEGHVDSTSDDSQHQDQKPVNQKRFQTDVQSLLAVFEDIGNPFNERTGILMALDSHIIAPSNVCDSVEKAYDLGLCQFNKFVEERLQGSMSLLAPLKRNKLPLFTYKAQTSTKDLKSLKLSELKSDCDLFSRLYIACQSRDGDLDEFFAHENHSYPPALSVGGNSRFGTKSDLIPCLV